MLHRRREVCALFQAVRVLQVAALPILASHLLPCSVLSLKGERELTVPERTAYLVFMINVFQSLENELIRSVALPLVSLPLWHSLSPGRLQVRLARRFLPYHANLTPCITAGARAASAVGEALAPPAAQGRQGFQAAWLHTNRAAAGSRLSAWSG